MRKIVLITAVCWLSSCATKQYPQAYDLSDKEIEVYSCDDIKKEIVKTNSMLDQIAVTGQFNELTILGIGGDLGIGNGIAKFHARSIAQKRVEQLNKIESIKCHASESTKKTGGVYNKTSTHGFIH